MTLQCPRLLIEVKLRAEADANQYDCPFFCYRCPGCGDNPTCPADVDKLDRSKKK